MRCFSLPISSRKLRTYYYIYGRESNWKRHTLLNFSNRKYPEMEWVINLRNSRIRVYIATVSKLSHFLKTENKISTLWMISYFSVRFMDIGYVFLLFFFQYSLLWRHQIGDTHSSLVFSIILLSFSKHSRFRIKVLRISMNTVNLLENFPREFMG